MEKSNSDARSLVEASAWRVWLAESGAGEGEREQRFQDWLAADPRNPIAWKRVNGPWHLFDEHPAAPEIISARRLALARAQEAGWKRWRGPTLLGKRQWQIAAVAATVLLALGLVFLNPATPEFDVYSTGVSERHTVMLEDGSTVSLDAQSEVRIRYTGNTRELTLSRGQAKFDVAHDAERPFSVSARGRKVVALGTSFNVDVLQSKLLVTLIDGRVVVVRQNGESPRPGRAARTDERFELTSGQQLIIQAESPPRIQDVNVALATAWQTGMISFDDETLSDAVARFSRYTDKRITVRDEASRGLRISGVFRTTDLDGFVATIAAYLPITPIMQANGDIEIVMRSTS